MGYPVISWLDEVRLAKRLPVFANSIECHNIVFYHSGFARQQLRGTQELIDLCCGILGLVDKRLAAFEVSQ